MKKNLTIILLLLALLPISVSAQRIRQQLGRAVVASTTTAGTDVLVSWRKLAQEPENCTYNLYKRAKGTTDYTKVNATPIDNTNYSTNRSAIPYDSELAVTMVANGVESEKSAPYLFKEQAWNNLFFDINFETSILAPNNYRCKYAYPMDLDGDGEYDAILADRHYNGTVAADPGCTTTTQKLQAYRLDGTHLWTMDLGPNTSINEGQNDKVLPFDINCDGKGEVILKSTYGTRFWDAENNTWGKYANFSETADTDGDGITDYRSHATRVPPYYISILDGETGKELYCSELKYAEINDGSDQYGRNKRANYMNDNEGLEYAFLTGKFAICYFDGIHPSLAVQCYNRDTNKSHHYYLCHWTFDWQNGTPSNWHHDLTWAFRRDGSGAAEFHQCRVADADGDGLDELFEGGYSWNPSKGQIAKPYIGHGDRFDVSDIDPDRPGMEVFAIQQSNLLGQVIYAAESGEHLQEWFLSGIGDVGRGRCMDINPDYKGYEVHSTMANIYSCKGEVVSTSREDQVCEGIWWDGDLLREMIFSPGGSYYGTNMVIKEYGGDRLIQPSKESGWQVSGIDGDRPAFVGDMMGDWREEIILAKQGNDHSLGLVGYATSTPTEYSFYTLLDDPAYSLDCLLRGYYQSPNTSFYLGHDMSYPPLPPVMTADNRWKSGTSWSTTSATNAFTSFDEKTLRSGANGESFIFDISGDNSQTINIEGTIQPSCVYIMNPKGHDYTFGGTGTLAGNMELWKSMQGTTTFNTNLAHTGNTIVSEGTLVVNGKIVSTLDLRAKGSFGGVATITGDVLFEGGLNYEGCRLIPGNDSEPYGVMTFEKSLTIPGGVYIVCKAASSQASKIMVNGDLTFQNENTFTIVKKEDVLAEGNYVIAECTGTLTCNVDAIQARGLDGVNYDFKVEGKQLLLVIHGSRSPLTGVEWTGNETNVWNYKDNNFQVGTGVTPFVVGDQVVFNDNSANRVITIDEQMASGGTTFDFSTGTYTLSGEGGIGGEGTLIKRGTGELKMNTTNSYTGATIIEDGTLTITELTNGGTEGPLGASTAAEGNLQLAGGTLKINALNMATDHIVTLTDTSTINVVKSNAAISLTGKVTGTGYLIKDGAGQLNFTYGGTNPFAGIIVKKGKIAQGAWNVTFGKAGSPMVLAGGTVQMLDQNGSSTRPVLNHKITVEDGTKNTIIGSSRGAINGSFHGTGQVTIQTIYVRSDVGANFANFEGKLIAQGNAGNFRLMDAVTDMKKTKLVINAGTAVGHYSSNGSTERAITTSIGELSSTATDCTLGHSQDSYNVGYLNTNASYRGMLKAKTITKVGTGIWTLTNEASTSSIIVSAGTLQPNNSITSTTLTPFTTGTVTVKSGAAVSGRGTIPTTTIQKGGCLKAGYNSGIGTLRGTGTVTLNEGSTMVLKLGTTSTGIKNNDVFRFEGKTIHKGDTILIVVDESRMVEAGEEVIVFEGDGAREGTYVLKTESPGQTIVWDDSALLSEGVLKVASVTGIQNTVVSDDTIVDVYTVDGLQLRSNIRRADALKGLAPGVYVIEGEKVSVK